MAVFVERELIARRGRKRTVLRVRIHAPKRTRGYWTCAHELLVNGKHYESLPSAGGEDALQALLLAIGAEVFSLERFENATGMTIERWSLFDIWPLRPRITLPGTRARAAAMRARDRELTAMGKQLRWARTSATRRAPAPRAKPAARKAPRRRRSAPRAS